MKLDTALYARLLREAADNPRLRQATDLRTSSADQSQRMLNALLPGTVVEPGAVVEYAILGEGCRIGRDCHVGGTPESTAPDPWGLTVLAPGCAVESGKRVAPGIMLNRNGEEVSK